MASIDPYAVGADSISARARLPYPQTRPVYNPLRACTYCAHGGVFMSYLDCAQYDCCHNKAGCCCLDGINVRHTGPGDAVCGSYRNSGGCGNVATDNQPASPETEIHCDDRAAAILRGAAAAPTTSALTSAAAAPNAPPAPRGRPPNNFIPERCRFHKAASLFYC